MKGNVSIKRICYVLLEEKLKCYSCGAAIIAYYSGNYKGDRGKCQICNTDFALD